MLTEIRGLSKQSAINHDGNIHPQYLASLIDCHEQVEFALLGSHLGNVDVEVADGIGLELLPSAFVATGLGQTTDPMPPEAAMQGLIASGVERWLAGHRGNHRAEAAYACGMLR